jgi:hypothetical protein
MLGISCAVCKLCNVGIEPSSWDRYYDFKNIFDIKVVILALITAIKVAQKDHNIGFQEKCQIFCENVRNLLKIVMLSLTPRVCFSS